MTLQATLLLDKEAVEWWENNKHLVYEQNIAYPVKDMMGGLLEPLSQQECIFDNEAHKITTNYLGLYPSLLLDLFYWNTRKTKSLIRIELDELTLNLIELRYIKSTKVKDISAMTGYSTQHIYNFFHKLKQIVTDELGRLKEGDMGDNYND